MQRDQRLKRELEDVARNPQGNVAFWPAEGPESYDLIARLDGPERSPYLGGVFFLRIHLPDRYPFDPPSCNFITPVYHPNIDDKGRICLDLLKMPPQGTWRPVVSLSTVLHSIVLLLAEPNPNDPLLPEIAKQYTMNRAMFEHDAREYTKRHAMAETLRGVSSATIPKLGDISNNAATTITANQMSKSTPDQQPISSSAGTAPSQPQSQQVSGSVKKASGVFAKFAKTS